MKYPNIEYELKVAWNIQQSSHAIQKKKKEAFHLLENYFEWLEIIHQ